MKDAVFSAWFSNDLSKFVINLMEESYVSEVAIYGYSHGGGSTHDLASIIAPKLGSVQLKFTGYIDAVAQPLINPVSERRRPLGSKYHMNYFQTHLPLRGNSIVANGGSDFECNVTNRQRIGRPNLLSKFKA